MSGRRRVRARIYWRERGGVRRAYADFRDFADVGGGRESLVAPRALAATSDPLIAEKLAADRLADLQGRRRNKAILGLDQQAALQEFAAYHLVEKARSGRFGEKWIGHSQKMLEVAIAFFGAGRDLASITVRDVQRYVAYLRDQTTPAGRPLSDGTIRHRLNVLSNLYRRAQAEGVVLPGYNPVAALMDKPSAKRQEAPWLEIHEAALLLEGPARTSLRATTASPTCMRCLPRTC